MGLTGRPSRPEPHMGSQRIGFAFGGHNTCAPSKGVDLQWLQFPPGNWVAPAGSHRSNEGRKRNHRSLRAIRVALGNSASRHAVARVNVEQDWKRPIWSPTLRVYGEGRRRSRTEKRSEYSVPRAIQTQQATRVLTTVKLAATPDDLFRAGEASGRLPPTTGTHSGLASPISR